MRTLLFVVLAALVPALLRAEGPSFERDVMAVLSKAGCNMGACHGNLNGKGGFKLSLRGEDPAADFAALTRALENRRVDVFTPDESLLLQKASGRIPHGGGVRLKPDTLGYRLLRDWMAGGAPGVNKKRPPLVRLVVTPSDVVLREPDDHVRLQVTAEFKDGSKRDVTELTTFELTNLTATLDGNLVTRRTFGETTVLARYLQRQAPVRIAFVPERKDFVWEAPAPSGVIDSLAFAKLQRLSIHPAPQCDDSTYIRRVHLDLLGTPPTAEQARAFVADETPDKRERLVDAALSRPAFADFWALKWADLLRTEEKVLDSRGVEAFHRWIRDAIAMGRRMDVFVRDLLASEGHTYDNPPTNFYRANRDPTGRAEIAARLFLGVRLQCARCHNHPYDAWTMDDYYSWSALFARVDYKVLGNDRKDKLDKNAFDGEQLVVLKTNGEMTNPRTGKSAPPRFLGADLPPGPHADRLQPLADWLTSPDNPFFARAQVNLVWYHLLGRGLVEPIDDVRLTNPPANPPLLDALAADFIANRFDLRQCIRTIAASQVYQASADPEATNATDEENFSHAYLRRLSAEQLVDSQSQVLGIPPLFNGYRRGTRAVQMRGAIRPGDPRGPQADGDQMLKAFGKPDRLLACECERSNETTLKQAFVLLGSESLEKRLTSADALPSRLAASQRTNAQIVDELYWTILSRSPTSAEISLGESQFATGPDRTAAVVDFAWALLNSKEFLFRN